MRYGMHSAIALSINYYLDFFLFQFFEWIFFMCCWIKRYLIHSPFTIILNIKKLLCVFVVVSSLFCSLLQQISCWTFRSKHSKFMRLCHTAANLSSWHSWLPSRLSIYLLMSAFLQVVCGQIVGNDVLLYNVTDAM